jgi:hypothetical protein
MARTADYPPARIPQARKLLTMNLVD